MIITNSWHGEPCFSQFSSCLQPGMLSCWIFAEKFPTQTSWWGKWAVMTNAFNLTFHRRWDTITYRFSSNFFLLIISQKCVVHALAGASRWSLLRHHFCWVMLECERRKEEKSSLAFIIFCEYEFILSSDDSFISRWWRKISIYHCQRNIKNDN